MTHAGEVMAHADRLAKRIVGLGGNDPTAPQVRKDISTSEEAHADDLASLLDGVAA